MQLIVGVGFFYAPYRAFVTAVAADRFDVVDLRKRDFEFENFVALQRFEKTAVYI